MYLSAEFCSYVVGGIGVVLFAIILLEKLFFLRCPHCGNTVEFTEDVFYAPTRDARGRLKTSATRMRYYHCESCRHSFHSTRTYGYF